MMWIKCICLISLVQMVDSMFSADKDNQSIRESLEEFLYFPSKRRRVDETMETSLNKNVLGGNGQRKWVEQGTSNYLEEGGSRGNLGLVIDATSVKPDGVQEKASEVERKKEIEQRVEELLEYRRIAIAKDNNPSSAYRLIETYMQSVFGKPGEQVEKGQIKYATSLLDWFSDYKNVQKLELKRYDLTCGFLKALLSILGLLEMCVLGRYEGLVIIRYKEKYNRDAKKTNALRTTKEDSLEHQDHLRESLPHVNTVHIPGHNFATSLTKKGLDGTKIYGVLTAWLRETKVERFTYSWEVRHGNKIYSCIVYHNLSEREEKDVIDINVWKITLSNENYKGKLTETLFPFVVSKATKFKIIVGGCIPVVPSFINSLLGNRPTFKCEIVFMNVISFYNFFHDINEHANNKSFKFGLKLDNSSLFYEKFQECKKIPEISSILWNLDTDVGRMYISTLTSLRAFINTERLKGLKRFMLVFPAQDSKLETVAAFFEVFGNNNGRISKGNPKTLQDLLIQYIDLVTLEELDFLNNNLQQLYITLDTVTSSGFRASLKKLEVHFIYEDVASQERNVLDINNFAINSDDMALISKMNVDKLNLRNVIFTWSRNGKECLDVMVPDKESRWRGKIYSENARYTMTEEERKKIKNERNKALKNIHNSYNSKQRILKKTCVKSLFFDSWLNEKASKLLLERNNKILKAYEEYKMFWENISVEWIINGLEHFGRNDNLATTSADQVCVPDSDDGYAFFTYLGLD